MSSSQKPADSYLEAEALLQLILFVDRRSTAKDQVQEIRDCLNTLMAGYSFNVQVVDVGEQPYLAEHFKLVATPALIKVRPKPQHTLAGTNLVVQLKNNWPAWEKSLEEAIAHPGSNGLGGDSIASAAKLMQMADEIFRLQREKEMLEDQLRFKERVIAMLAHDLRNPLTAASIALETLEGYWEQEIKSVNNLTPEMLIRLTQHARTQTQVIERMITNLLQTSRTKTAELHIHPRKLDLGTCSREVVEQLQAKFALKAQQVKADIPSDLPCVHADGDRVRQVMVNLLENACKYTPEAGLIQVSILHRTTQKVQVSICDNGPGIPLENRERIFEDEFRLQRDESQEGYGIGLALCRRIIRAHYGQIWVDSSPGQGSCFHFTLPVYRA